MHNTSPDPYISPPLAIIWSDFSYILFIEDKWERKGNTLSFQESLKRNKHKKPILPSFPFQFYIDFSNVGTVMNGLLY